MSFIQDVRDGINRHIEKNYPTFNGFCSAQKIGQGKLWKFLNGYVEVGKTTPTGMNSMALG